MNDIRKTLILLKNINKYGIFALTLICIIYCGLMYFGYDYFGIHLALFGFALGLRLTLSKVFGLCWVHRLCIIYIFLISFCVATLIHNIFPTKDMVQVDSIRLGVWDNDIFKDKFKDAINNPNIKFVCNSVKGWSKELEIELNKIINDGKTN